MIRMLTIRKRLTILIAAIAALVSHVPVRADDNDLAQRFRPYFKMSQGSGSGDEPIHPATWQLIVEDSTLNQNGTDLVSPGHWSSTFSELNDHGGDITTNPGDSGLELAVNSGAYSGEVWSAVIHSGDGIYAHVQRINSTQVNIEYTIVWPRNEPPTNPALNHDGDITSMVVVYDQTADLISRLSYSAHGCILQIYQLRPGLTQSIDDLAGNDENFSPHETAVARIEVADEDSHHVVSNPCHGVTTSESHVFLAEDPGTHLYEHPVVFVEIGSHEFWPNASGFLAGAGGHDGNGVSFLSDSVQILGTVANPVTAHLPFVRYNGKFGGDPQAIVLHTTWCWPPACGTNNLGIVEGRFTDKNPYSNDDGLQWPPPAFGAASGQVFVTQPNWQSTGTGSESKPIPGFQLAYSLAPAGSVLNVSMGPAAGTITLDRAMTITSSGLGAWFGGLPE